MMGQGFARMLGCGLGIDEPGPMGVGALYLRNGLGEGVPIRVALSQKPSAAPGGSPFGNAVNARAARASSAWLVQVALGGAADVFNAGGATDDGRVRLLAAGDVVRVASSRVPGWQGAAGDINFTIGAKGLSFVAGSHAIGEASQ